MPDFRTSLREYTDQSIGTSQFKILVFVSLVGKSTKFVLIVELTIMTRWNRKGGERERGKGKV